MGQNRTAGCYRAAPAMSDRTSKPPRSQEVMEVPELLQRELLLIKPSPGRNPL
jgi:hypothetical protein